MPTMLITGANRGLGLEVVRNLDEQAGSSHACCRAPDKADALQDIAANAGGRIQVHALEVTDFAAVEKLAGTLSGEPIDVLFNNAGIMEGKQRTFDHQGTSQAFGHIAYDDWRYVLRVNVLAPMRMMEVFADHVASSERKVMATMSSIMGSIEKNTDGGWYPYRTSKTAVNMMMRNVAGDLKDRGITAVAIHPGWVQTDMGGPGADITAEVSGKGLAAVIAGITPEQTGHYLVYDGTELPW